MILATNVRISYYLCFRTEADCLCEHHFVLLADKLRTFFICHNIDQKKFNIEQENKNIIPELFSLEQKHPTMFKILFTFHTTAVLNIIQKIR